MMVRDSPRSGERDPGMAGELKLIFIFTSQEQAPVNVLQELLQKQGSEMMHLSEHILPSHL